MFLLVGPPGVGKTLMLKRLQNNSSTALKDEVPPTIPTVGTNLMTITTVKKAEVTIREMGGAMGPIWHKYYKESHAVMFMIDLSCPSQVAISCVQLATLLSHPTLHNVPVLVILNKKDSSIALSRADIESLMRLEDMVRHATQKITILETSAKTGFHLERVSKWVHNHQAVETFGGS